MLDHYAVLEVPRGADLATIMSAHDAKSAFWAGRAREADLAGRSEAESRLSAVTEAYATLRDPHLRARYDQELSSSAAASPDVPPQRSPVGDHLSEASRLFDAGDPRSAAAAARRATEAAPDTAFAWYLLAASNQALGKHGDALYEAQRAVALDDSDADHHALLAQVAHASGDLDQARSACARAAELAPDEPRHAVNFAMVLSECGDDRRAVRVLEAAHERFPHDALTRDVYAASLLESAEKVPQHQYEGDQYLVTSPREIEAMRRHLARASAVRSTDRDVSSGITATEQHLRGLESRCFSAPNWVHHSASAGASDVLMAHRWVRLLPLILAFIAAFLVLTGLGGVLSGQFGGIFGVAIGGLGLWGLYKGLWVPRWKANERLAARRADPWKYKLH